jgi:hypothetical protein
MAIDRSGEKRERVLDHSIVSLGVCAVKSFPPLAFIEFW